jgi:hypothetical protein
MTSLRESIAQGNTPSQRGYPRRLVGRCIVQLPGLLVRALPTALQTNGLIEADHMGCRYTRRYRHSIRRSACVQRGSAASARAESPRGRPLISNLHICSQGFRLPSSRP